MRYTVLWSDVAERALKHLLRRKRSQDVFVSVGEIDESLSLKPLELGESRNLRQRVWHSPPLGVIYSVLQNVKLVLVLGVWIIDRSNGDR